MDCVAFDTSKPMERASSGAGTPTTSDTAGNVKNGITKDDVKSGKSMDRAALDVVNDLLTESAPKHDPGDLSRTPDIKIILLGDSAVGKSKLLERFLVRSYCERTTSTYALSRYLYDFVDPETGKTYLVDFWDTAGQEQFGPLHPSFYYQANCAILAFDVTRKITYTNLEAWWTEMRKYCHDVPTLCIGNKIDADPKCVERSFKFPERHELPFHFASAADGANVARVFSQAISLAINNKENPPDPDLAEMYRLLEQESPPNTPAAATSTAATSIDPP